MKHIIDKSFDFCYGHRVHNQQLDTRYTHNNDGCLACRHMHGHQGKIKLFLSEITPGININDCGMVTDFKHTGWFKNFLDDVLDHKMILDINDPLNSENTVWVLDDDENVDREQLIHFPEENYWIPDMSKIVEYMKNFEDDPLSNPKNQAIYEKYEGLVFVDFVPTSENLSAWLLEIARNKMKDIPNVEVVAVEFWETPKSHCRVEY
jgi:6-pyruvoyltetrahydropterin/6-carboxytetrahydropterin synthase